MIQTFDYFPFASEILMFFLGSLVWTVDQIYDRWNKRKVCSYGYNGEEDFNETKWLLCKEYLKGFDLKFYHVVFPIVIVTSFIAFISKYDVQFHFYSLPLLVLPFILFGVSVRKEEEMWKSGFRLLLREKGVDSREFQARIDAVTSPSKPVKDSMGYLLGDLLCGNYVEEKKSSGHECSLFLGIDGNGFSGWPSGPIEYHITTSTGNTPFSITTNLNADNSLKWNIEKYSLLVSDKDDDSFGRRFEIELDWKDGTKYVVGKNVVVLIEKSFLRNGSWVEFEGEKQRYTKIVNKADFTPKERDY